MLEVQQSTFEAISIYTHTTSDHTHFDDSCITHFLLDRKDECPTRTDEIRYTVLEGLTCTCSLTILILVFIHVHLLCVCVCLCEGDRVSPEECKQVAQAHSEAVRHWRKRKRMVTLSLLYIRQLHIIQAQSAD